MIDLTARRNAFRNGILADAAAMFATTLGGLRIIATHTLLVPFDGGGGVVPGGQIMRVPVRWNCTILEWTIIADSAGTLDLDVERGTALAYPAVSSIVAAAPPSLAGLAINTDIVLEGWSRLLAKGDVLVIATTGTPTVGSATLALLVREG